MLIPKICEWCGNEFRVQEYNQREQYCQTCRNRFSEEDHINHIAYLYRQVQYNRGYEYKWNSDGTCTKVKRNKKEG